VRGEFDVEYDHVNNILNLGEKEREKAKLQEKEDVEAEEKVKVVNFADENNAEEVADKLASIQKNVGNTDDGTDDFTMNAEAIAEKTEAIVDVMKETITPVIVNKGINTNNNWWQKAGTIFKKKTVEEKYRIENEEETKKKHLRKRRAKKKPKPDVKKVKKSTIAIAEFDEIQAAANSAKKDNGFDDEDSDGEDGGRTLAKHENSVLPGSEIHNQRNKKKHDLSNWSDPGIGITHPKSKKEKIAEFVWYKLTDIHEMEMFNISITQDPSLTNKPAPDRIMRRKMIYLYEELIEDLGGNSLFTVEYWLTVLVLLSAVWMRMYFHYMGQWLLLKLYSVPLFGFKTGSLEIIIKYTSSNITTWLEVLVVAVGQVFNTLILAFCSFCCYLLSRAVGRTPEIISKFVLSFGVATILDPVLILFVDLCHLNFDCTIRSFDCEYVGERASREERNNSEVSATIL